MIFYKCWFPCLYVQVGYVQVQLPGLRNECWFHCHSMIYLKLTLVSLTRIYYCTYVFFTKIFHKYQCISQGCTTNIQFSFFDSNILQMVCLTRMYYKTQPVVPVGPGLLRPCGKNSLSLRKLSQSKLYPSMTDACQVINMDDSSTKTVVCQPTSTVSKTGRRCKLAVKRNERCLKTYFKPRVSLFKYNHACLCFALCVIPRDTIYLTYILVQLKFWGKQQLFD